jgi:Protein of unknown function (DUF551)
MSEWISVKDRLPETGDDVLVWLDHGCELASYLIPYGWQSEFINWLEWAACRVNITHWMPLPEAPKEKA